MADITMNPISWTPLSDWPDIKTILSNDTTEGYSGKFIYLIPDYSTAAVLTGGAAYRTSDGAFYTADTTHTWNTANDFNCIRGYKTRWVTVYLNTDTLSTAPADISYYLWLVMDCNVSIALSFGGLFKSLEFINNKVFTGVSSYQNFLNETNSIEKLPDITITGTGKYAFETMNSIKYIDSNIDLSAATNINSMFGYNYNLSYITNALDVTSVPNNVNYTSSFFKKCYNLVHVLIKNLGFTIDLTTCPLLSHESLIYLINNAKTITGLTGAMLLGSNNVSKLTEEEKIIASNKGWIIEKNSTSILSPIIYTKGTATETINLFNGGLDLTTNDWKWSKGVLASNGKIYCIPYNDDNVLCINTADNTVTKFSSGITGTTYKWKDGILASNGKIYCVPQGARTILCIDTSNNTCSTFGSVSTSFNDFILASNGKIYGIPNGGTSILCIDTTDNSISSFGTISKTYFNPVLASNNKIYAIASDILCIDTTNDSLSTFGSLTTDYSWSKGILASDGKIYYTPYSAMTVLCVDPANNSITGVGYFSSSISYKWSNSIIANDSKIYHCPSTGAYVLCTDFVNKITSSIYVEYPIYIKFILAPNNKIYGCNETYVLCMDPANKVYTLHATGSSSYSDMVLANNKIYCIPNAANMIMEISNIA